MKTTILIKPSCDANNKLNAFVKPYKMVNTSIACPEQYDVYHNDVLVGYFRLRHSRFKAECVLDRTVVYESSIKDMLGLEAGCFFSDIQRIQELKKAIDSLNKHLLKINLLK